MPAVRVRFPAGPLNVARSLRKRVRKAARGASGLRRRTEGSRIPVRRAALLRRVAVTGLRVRLPPLPLARALVVKRNHPALRTRGSRFESWLGYSDCGFRIVDCGLKMMSPAAFNPRSEIGNPQST